MTTTATMTPTMMKTSNSSNSDWINQIVDSILINRSHQAITNFKHQPLANKLTAVETAIVPPRKTDTAEKISSLIKELVNVGALRPEEAGSVYSDVLIRVHRYNSSNVQANVDTLVKDIRAAQSEAIRNTDIVSLSNQTVLNSFLKSLPETVPSGQQNYEALKQTLRLFVNEAPNVTVFKSGPDTLLQVNIKGVNTVNLNAAFRNLQSFWGVVLDGEFIPPNITSKLTANTRVLLLFLAPFTNVNTFTPDTFLNSIFQIYRETVSASLERPEETEREVQEIARNLGTEGLDLTQSLGYLIKQKTDAVINPYTLSPRQLQILRFIQESLADRIDRNGEDPLQALDNVHLSFAPSFYEANGPFIRKLITYLHIALEHSPTYFREIYANKHWVPPISFWTGNYSDFHRESRPQYEIQRRSLMGDDDYNWEDFQTASGSSRTASTRTPSLTSESITTQSTPVVKKVMRSMAKATIPPLASMASEYYVPGSGNIAGPIVGALASAALTPAAVRHFTQTRVKHARDRAIKRLRRIREANDPDREETQSSQSGDTVISPLLGDGIDTVKINPFAHLCPKNGVMNTFN